MVSWEKSHLWQSQRDKDVYCNELVVSPVQVRFKSLQGLGQLGLYTRSWQSRRLLTQHALQNLCVESKTIKKSVLKTIALLIVRRHRAFASLQASMARADEMLTPDWVWRTSFALAAETVALDSNASCHFSAFCFYQLLHLFVYKGKLYISIVCFPRNKLYISIARFSRNKCLEWLWAMSSWDNTQSPDSFFDWINYSEKHILPCSQQWLGHSDKTLLCLRIAKAKW